MNKVAVLGSIRGFKLFMSYVDVADRDNFTNVKDISCTMGARFSGVIRLSDHHLMPNSGRLYNQVLSRIL